MKLESTLIAAIFIGSNACALSSPSNHLKREERKVILTVSATAYCLRGRTATGTKPRIGTVAVDPRIIPLGSIIFVENYGWARAEDTGSAIKGKRIDVWLPSRKQALKWGVKRVKVVVYPKPKERQTKQPKPHKP